MSVALDAAELKQLVKDALSELLIEHREELHDLMVETFEDIALMKAIQEGENTALVSRDSIFRLLENES